MINYIKLYTKSIGINKTSATHLSSDGLFVWIDVNTNDSVGTRLLTPQHSRQSNGPQPPDRTCAPSVHFCNVGRTAITGAHRTAYYATDPQIYVRVDLKLI